MRTITTTSTRQLATALANAEARKVTTAAIPHLVRATDDEVEAVKARLDDIVAKHQEATPGQYDPSALTSTQAASVQDSYLERKANGRYDSEQPVTL